MPSTIQYAVRKGRMVSLGDVQRGETGLTCYICGDKLVLKDGRARFVDGNGRRNRSKAKHFSHTPVSRCHGEGLAHYRLKVAICAGINVALAMPAKERNMHGSMPYLCPDDEYGPRDIFKHAPGMDAKNPQLPSMEKGYHHFNLLRDLAKAECEVSLDAGITRADVAGLDRAGRVLWAIEIKRTCLRRAAIEHAEREGIPLFVVDISRLTRGSGNDPFAEIDSIDYVILMDNLGRGFLPSATESYNTKCERREFGVGPTDTYWQQEITYVHCGPDDCNDYGCPDWEEVLLHECGGGEDALGCPDAAYMRRHGIGRVEMYTDPVYWVHSHAYFG